MDQFVLDLIWSIYPIVPAKHPQRCTSVEECVQWLSLLDLDFDKLKVSRETLKNYVFKIATNTALQKDALRYNYNNAVGFPVTNDNMIDLIIQQFWKKLNNVSNENDTID